MFGSGLSRWLGTWCAVLLTTSIQGHAADDKEGADHPLLSRYPGAYIRSYLQSEYDRAGVMTGPMIRNEQRKQTVPVTNVEGKVTNIEYRLDGTQTSLLQIYKNYERALQRLKANVSFGCFGKDCHPEASSGRALSNEMNRIDTILKGVRADGGQEAAVITANTKTATLMVVIGVDNVNERRTIALSIVEQNQLDADKLVIGSVDEIHEGIVSTGKIVLDGIYFDHNEATIKAESTPVLTLLAEYLAAHSDNHYFVVGHTDATGSYEYNLALSTRRAAAVKTALVDQYSMKPEQLSTVGVGPVAPAASNRNEEGLALNRRVELVEVP